LVCQHSRVAQIAIDDGPEVKLSSDHMHDDFGKPGTIAAIEPKSLPNRRLYTCHARVFANARLSTDDAGADDVAKQ
jgi:hypothetical protein